MYACNDMELFSRFLCLSLDPRKYGKGVDVWSCGVSCRIIEDVTYNLYKCINVVMICYNIYCILQYHRILLKAQ